MGMADKQIYGGLCPGGSERLNRIFRLMQTGKADPTPMTTHEFGFDEIERAFAMMQNKEDGIIKPLIHLELVTKVVRVRCSTALDEPFRRACKSRAATS